MVSIDWSLAGLAGLAALLITAAVVLLYRALVRTSDKEQKRRLFVNQRGRMGEAVITDYRDQHLYYTYEIGGVTYTASQDLSGLDQLLPQDGSCFIGVSALKYHPKNPANSIVFCESWSGLRPAGTAASPTQSVTKGFQS